jgi:hypothetical protein
VEYTNCLGTIIANDARYTREIKLRIARAKAAFRKKEALFTSKLDLRKKLVWCLNLETSEIRSEIPGKF